VRPDQWARIKPIFAEAAERPSAERSAFIESRCNGDQSLISEIQSLLGAYDQAGSFIEDLPRPTAAPETDHDIDRMIGRKIGAYELVLELGRGGMGSVYLASRADDEFRKFVAVKLINSNSDNESINRRFRNERQILASLEHPNIARLLDGGTTEDGSPYFVMEYIEGKPIRDYCDDCRLNTDQRLELFRDVCSAVHYSHQNLVVHRDLKPGNILVTKDGTAKLLDFGIAKVIGSSTGFVEATLTKSRVMTPEYASPEQVRGETVTTSSDTYSLGVILYVGLSTLEILRAVCEQEPERPSTAVGRNETTDGSSGLSNITPEEIGRARGSRPDRLRKKLTGDLDNIVLKAMRKEPQRRYASVEQFSEDIRRHLVGLPVLARKDTIRYRTGKLLRRNKRAVGAVAVIVLLIAAGVAGVARETVIAERQRARAEKRFNEVRELAHSFMFKFHDAIKNLAGATEARQLVVSESLSYLNSLAEEASDDPGLQRELADAYEELAEIQGFAGGSNLGDKPGALASYRKAVAIRELIVGSASATIDDRRKLADLYSRFSTVADGTDKLKYAQKGLETVNLVLAADPTNEKARLSAELSHHFIGQQLAATGDLNGALENYREMQSIIRELFESDPSNKAYQHDLALSCKKIGGVLIVTGDLSGAAESYNKALDIERARVASDANNASTRLDLSYTLSDLALIFRKTKDYTRALNAARESLAIREELSAADPKDERARVALAAIYHRLGNLHFEMEEFEGALQYFRRCLEIRQILAASSTAKASDKLDLVDAFCEIAESHIGIASKAKSPVDRRRHWQDARSANQDALEVSEALDKQGVKIGAEHQPARLKENIAKCEAELRKH
jgi:eukaryotic-like serine/threonine-protein kinase